jgi:hypothetical protein
MLNVKYLHVYTFMVLKINDKKWFEWSLEAPNSSDAVNDDDQFYFYQN